MKPIREVERKKFLSASLDVNRIHVSEIQHFMAALRSRCGHYIFALWFLSSSFFLA